MTSDVNYIDKLNILGSRFNTIDEKIFSDLSLDEKQIIIQSVDANSLDSLLYLTSYDIKDLNNIILFLEGVIDNSTINSNGDTKTYKMKKARFLLNSILVVLRYINLDYLKELKLNKNIDIYKLYIKDCYFFYEKGFYSNFREPIYKELSDNVTDKLKEKGIEDTNIHNEVIKYFNSKKYFDKLFPLKIFIKDDKFDNGIGMKMINNRLDEIINHYLLNDLSKDSNRVTIEDVTTNTRPLKSNELQEIFKNIKVSIRNSKKEKLNLDKLYKYEEKLIKNIYKIVYEVLLNIDKEKLLKSEELKLNLKVEDEVFKSYLNYNIRYFSYLEKEYISKQISLHLLETFENYPINILGEIKASESTLRKYIKYIVLTELYDNSSTYFKIKEIDLLNYEKLFNNVPSNLLKHYEDTNFKLLSDKKFIDFKNKDCFELFKFVFFGLNYLNEDFLKFISKLENSEVLIKDYLDCITKLTYNKGEFTNLLNNVDKSNYLKGKGSIDDKLELFIFLKNKVSTTSLFEWFKIKSNFLEDNSISKDIVKLYKNESNELLNSIPDEKDIMRMERFILLLKKYNIDSMYENTEFLDSVTNVVKNIQFDKSNRFFSLKINENNILIFGYRYIILKSLSSDNTYNLNLIYKTPGEISTYKGFLLGVSYVKESIKNLNTKSNNIDMYLTTRQINCIYKIIEDSWDLRKKPLDEFLIKDLKSGNYNYN